MNSSFDSQTGSQFESESQENDPIFARSVLGSVNTAARAGVVNRTHRVVRQRAKVIQERRSHVRS